MRYRFALILHLILFGSFCGKSGGEIQFDPENQPKFYSENNPGKWQNMKEDHIPRTEIQQKGKEKIITVTTAFPQSPAHYVEVLVLADHTHKELQNIKFVKTESPRAEFTLPSSYRSKAYVIMKCNLHDMWEVELSLDQ